MQDALQSDERVVQSYSPQPRPQSEMRVGGQKHACGRVVRFEIFLDDESAHRMADEDGRRLERARHLLHVRDVIGDATAADLAFATGVSAQTECGGAVAVVREEREEGFIPAPGAMPHAVDEEEGGGVGEGFWGAGDGFEVHVGNFSSRGPYHIGEKISRNFCSFVRSIHQFPVWSRPVIQVNQNPFILCNYQSGDQITVACD